MKVVIRVDASEQIGTGHLVRCLTLAEELRRQGAEVQFICRDHPGHLIHLLTGAAFPATVLPVPQSAGNSGEDYAAWLGVSQNTDADQTFQALAGQRPDWLIVDHYGLDRTWEQQLRPQVDQLFAIDDLANRPHECDGLLDQNERAGGEARYGGLVSAGCRLLVGARYALLRPEYASYRQVQPPRAGEVRRVLVFFGGTDPQNMTGKAIEALSAPEFEALTVDVVVGATNPHRAELEQQAAGRSRMVLHYYRSHLADLMAQADLALGAGGTTTWERCCLGLPTLVVSVAKNQVSACQELDRVGVIVYTGSMKSVDVAKLQHAIAQLIKTKEKLVAIAKTGQTLVDGLGTKRVSSFLLKRN
ncbi:UDP-2,4-diacetamido-2,4,6-trideoxy-beta-L-altropyranose hydrolase [Planktothrix agardhii]|uniref:UDP-2,4-diacetamido-2,4, 6-trideoxy-beta-L-altropyranose hydrolase n=1 Tax=Planktothrix agardhii TaxID=1160 RepID=UPI002B1FCEF3|nr:UDP-2,4-diacetamido-2,4,6-trideoxy-beta-L-altropyranose hydrolase [Planktothrix agardhii]MEA5561128.1 UDP-2,4-diacetamido-2,4,6-trideoxy-beta-L-altropyranose hydrolase [Planktothrix agardhii UHCC 0887]